MTRELQQHDDCRYRHGAAHYAVPGGRSACTRVPAGYRSECNVSVGWLPANTWLGRRCDMAVLLARQVIPVAAGGNAVSLRPVCWPGWNCVRIQAQQPAPVAVKKPPAQGLVWAVGRSRAGISMKLRAFIAGLKPYGIAPISVDEPSVNIHAGSPRRIGIRAASMSPSCAALEHRDNDDLPVIPWTALPVHMRWPPTAGKRPFCCSRALRTEQALPGPQLHQTVPRAGAIALAGDCW